MTRHLIACLALGSSLLVTSPAAAQAPTICSEHVVTGTVGHQLMFGAAATNAKLFSASKMAESYLLPFLYQEGVTAATQYTVTTTAGALTIPVCRGDEDGDVRLAKVDLGAASFGGGINLGPVVVFATGSATTHAVANGKWNERYPTAFALPFGGLLMIPAAPFKREFARDDMSVTLDYIAGLEANTPWVKIGAGWVGSKGLYLHLFQDQTRLSGSAIVDDSGSVPYLRAGLESFAFIADFLGDTAIFGRILEYAFPSQESGGDLFEIDPTQFWTIHLEQYNIFDRFDVRLAMQLQPEPTLHELTLTFHNPGYTSRERMLANPKAFMSNEGGLKFTAGVIRMPDQWYHGVKGGYRFHAEASMFFMFSGFSDANTFFFSLGFNSPEMLTQFPYAQNAGQLTLAGGFPL